MKPGDDFFMSQNGAWFAQTQLGPQQPATSYWRDLRNLSPRRIDAMLRELAADQSLSLETPAGKAAAFYRSFVDDSRVETKGLSPLAPELQEIKTIKTKDELAFLMGRMSGPETSRFVQTTIGPRIGRDGAFSINIEPDKNNPHRYAVYVGQAGIYLPFPEYYSDPKLADIKAAYEDYVTKILSMLDWPDAAARAHDVVALETRIASASWSHDQIKDQSQTYNPMSVSDLSRLAPAFNWRAFLKGANLGGVTNVVVDAKTAFPKIAEIFAETPVEVWQARQAFLVTDDAANSGCLNTAAFNLTFDFRSRRFINGSTATPPRTSRAYQTLSHNIGDILSSLYVARYFPPEAKVAATQMAENVRKAFDSRLANLSWMSVATKKAARQKLSQMRIRVGYPDRFQNYSGVRISDDDLYGNVVRATAYKWDLQVKALKGRFDDSKWTLAAESANYFYGLTTNSVEVPAGFLQPPFFDLHADPSINYGAAGAVIGLTIVSAFNNQGRHFDGDGRLRDWWSAQDVKSFKELTDRLSQQYGAQEPLPGLHVKGDLVVDEAMSDIGGLMAALDAYHLSLNGGRAQTLNGLTGDQRVFLGWAQLWRAKFDTALLRNQIAAGVNAPPTLRVNGPVRNIDAWYEAFGVQSGDKLYLAPEARVRIW
jgi:putative endopeptidase